MVAYFGSTQKCPQVLRRISMPKDVRFTLDIVEHFTWIFDVGSTILRYIGVNWQFCNQIGILVS